MLKINFSNFPILIPSIFISIIFMLVSFFYMTPRYTSESIISVSSEADPSINSAMGIVNNILGSNVDNSVGDLISFLESDNATNDLNKAVNIESIYSSSHIDLFSRYKKNSKVSLKKYLKKRINLKSDSSGNLVIESTAFTPEDAFKINLAIIMISSNFFDKRQSLTSKIAIQKDLCQFEISKDGITNENINFLLNIIEPKSSDIKVGEYNSANEMLLNKADLFSEFCSSPSKKSNLSKIDIPIPNSTLRDLNNESLKQLISNIYRNSISTITMSDALEIIAEPSIANKENSKNIFLNSLIVLLFSILFFSTLLIIYKLRKDFSFNNE